MARQLYSTVEELVSVLTDKRQTQMSADSGSTKDTATLTAIIRDASIEIDNALTQRYVTPITDAASVEMLGPICRVIARFKMYARRDVDPRMNPVWKEYDQAVKVTLPGLVLPPTASTQVDPVVATPNIVASGSDRPVFGRGIFSNDLRGYYPGGPWR
jgi:phage gp36-like protein